MIGLLKILDRICHFGSVIGALVLACLFLIGLAEILARNLMDFSLGFASEYAGYGVAVVLMLGAGEAVRTDDHVRVSLLSEALTGEAQRIIDVAATILGLGVASFFAVALIGYAFETGAAGTLSYFPSQTPLVVPQTLLALGPVCLVSGLLARLLRLLGSSEGEVAE